MTEMTDARGQDDPRFNLLEELCAELEVFGEDTSGIRGWFARGTQKLSQRGVILEIIRLIVHAGSTSASSDATIKGLGRMIAAGELSEAMMKIHRLAESAVREYMSEPEISEEDIDLLAQTILPVAYCGGSREERVTYAREVAGRLAKKLRRGPGA